MQRRRQSLEGSARASLELGRAEGGRVGAHDNKGELASHPGVGGAVHDHGGTVHVEGRPVLAHDDVPGDEAHCQRCHKDS